MLLHPLHGVPCDQLRPHGVESEPPFSRQSVQEDLQFCHVPLAAADGRLHMRLALDLGSPLHGTLAQGERCAWREPRGRRWRFPAREGRRADQQLGFGPLHELMGQLARRQAGSQASWRPQDPG